MSQLFTERACRGGGAPFSLYQTNATNTVQLHSWSACSNTVRSQAQPSRELSAESSVPGWLHRVAHSCGNTPQPTERERGHRAGVQTSGLERHGGLRRDVSLRGRARMRNDVPHIERWRLLCVRARPEVVKAIHDHLRRERLREAQVDFELAAGLQIRI